MAQTDSGGGKRSTEDRIGDPANLAKSSTPPPQPDYIGAANAQSRGTIGAGIASNLMSHPDVYTPLGSQTWRQTGSQKINIPGLGEIDIPQYAQDMKLSPEQQKLYEGTTGLQQDALTRAGTSLNAPQELQSVQDVSDKAYDQMTARLGERFDRNKDMQRTQLINQGLREDTEAYRNAMGDLAKQETDAYTQAALAANQLMPQTLQMSQAIRGLPLQELNAIRMGSPVNMPQFQPVQYPGSGNIQGPNTLNATQQQGAWQQALYNQMVQQNNARAGGAASIGGSVLSAFL